MIYKIVRHDKESDDITEQSFSSYDEVYGRLDENILMFVVLMLIMETLPVMKLRFKESVHEP